MLSFFYDLSFFDFLGLGLGLELAISLGIALSQSFSNYGGKLGYWLAMAKEPCVAGKI
jgi:hypothetical protein